MSFGPPLGATGLAQDARKISRAGKNPEIRDVYEVCLAIGWIAFAKMQNFYAWRKTITQFRSGRYLQAHIINLIVMAVCSKMIGI